MQVTQDDARDQKGSGSDLHAMPGELKEDQSQTQQGFHPLSAAGWVWLLFPERAKLRLRNPIND